jgi:hypothetical protein
MHARQQNMRNANRYHRTIQARRHRGEVHAKRVKQVRASEVSDDDKGKRSGHIEEGCKRGRQRVRDAREASKEEGWT